MLFVTSAKMKTSPELPIDIDISKNRRVKLA
jgi:hypothetical protein